MSTQEVKTNANLYRREAASGMKTIAILNATTPDMKTLPKKDNSDLIVDIDRYIEAHLHSMVRMLI